MPRPKYPPHLLRRLWQYQAERFPLAAHGLLIAAFTFSAIAYARLCRGLSDFIGWPFFALGVFITFTLFLLLRITDEHKDADDDARYRPELPVPRGLVSLGELRNLGLIVFALQIGVQAIWLPQMLPLFAVVTGYLALMSREFFVADWLRRHQFWYVLSHMVIIPLVDVYASGLDWRLAGVSPPLGLLFFFAVSYCNGLVLEIGRKIRAPEQESEGVLTYTAQLGRRRAPRLWVGLLLLTLGWTLTAAHFAGLGKGTFIFLILLAVTATGPAFLFLRKPLPGYAKAIEYASALWTLVMYLSLGGLPMLRSLWST